MIENALAYVDLLDESRRGAALVSQLLDDKRRVRAEQYSKAARDHPERLRAVRQRHARAVEALQMWLRCAMSDAQDETSPLSLYESTESTDSTEK